MSASLEPLATPLGPLTHSWRNVNASEPLHDGRLRCSGSEKRSEECWNRKRLWQVNSTLGAPSMGPLRTRPGSETVQTDYRAPTRRVRLTPACATQ